MWRYTNILEDKTGALGEAKAPLVSVIMPAYNAARFIAEAVASVLSQTLRDWELIVVDDGSHDSTLDIIRSVKDSRLHSFTQANRGEGTARNVALSHATGEYLAFLDSDDLYLPTALEQLSSFLIANPQYGAVYSNGWYVDEFGRRLLELSDHRPAQYVGNLLEPLVVNPSVIAAINCVMVRHTIIIEHELQFDEKLRIGPDWDFLIRLARHTQFGYLSKQTCMYRIHGDNITTTTGSSKRNDDLIRGRMKVLNSTWFGSLSLETRRALLHNLVVVLLHGQLDRQEDILTGRPISQLGRATQEALWRQVGVSYVLSGEQPDFALRCIEEAATLSTGDLRTILLLRSSVLGWPALRVSASIWSRIHALRERLQCRRNQPRAAPFGLDRG